MASVSTQTPYPRLASITDLLAIPEDQRFHEVLDGEVIPKELTSFPHGYGLSKVGGWISAFNRQPNGPARPGGWFIAIDITIELSPHQVLRPDIAGWRREHMPELPRVMPVRLRPDWVCEVMSGGDARRRDGVQKRRIYADAGVPHYWLIDTERERLTVLRLDKEGYVEVLDTGRGERVRAEPFDALELPVGVLFGDDVD